MALWHSTPVRFDSCSRQRPEHQKKYIRVGNCATSGPLSSPCYARRSGRRGSGSVSLNHRKSVRCYRLAGLSIPLTYDRLASLLSSLRALRHELLPMISAIFSSDMGVDWTWRDDKAPTVRSDRVAQFRQSIRSVGSTYMPFRLRNAAADDQHVIVG